MNERFNTANIHSDTPPVVEQTSTLVHLCNTGDFNVHLY